MTLIDSYKKELLESKYDTVCIDGQFAIVSKNMKFGCVNFVRKYKIDEHHVVSGEILELLLSAKHVFVSNNTVFGERQAPS